MRFFAFVGSLVVLVLVAALVLPSYVDWNQFKSRFEQEASRTLGLPVKVKGQAGIRLLPLPSVTFTDIEIGASADSVPILVADSFKIDVELAPLLKGDVVVVDMQLSAPILNVDLNKSGQLVIPDFEGQNLQLQATNVSLENITVSNARVRINDARFNRTVDLNNLDVTASAGSLSGPWKVNGTVQYEEEKYRLSVQSGIWQEAQQIRLNMEVEAQSLPYDLEFSGPLSFKDGIPAWKGTMKLAPMGQQGSEDLIAFRRPDVSEAFPVRLESELEIASGGANVPEFELNIGSTDDPYRLNGSGQAVFGENVSFRLRAEGQQVNVERFSANEEGAGLDFNQRLGLFREFLDRIPRFEADGEINLYLPAVVAGDTVIREVGMDLRPASAGTGWQINNLEAQLPGRTELRADGDLVLGEDFGYQGELILASSQPSGFAKWLGSEVSPAIRDLSAAGISANAQIYRDVIEFNNVELVLNQAVLKGSVRRTATDGERPDLVAKLEGDAVDFDQLNALFDLFAGGDGQNIVEGHDLDLDLKANSMAVSGLQANEVIARLAIKGDQLTISQLDIGDMDRAVLNINGVIDGIGSQPVGRLSTRLAADDPSKFLDVMNKRFGPFPLVKHIVANPPAIRNSQLEFEFEGQEDSYRLTVAGISGGSEIDALLTGDDISKSLDKQEINGKLIVVNNEASDLLLQFGIPAIALKGTGRAAVRILASGVAEQGLQTESALTVSDGYLSAEGTLKPMVVDEDLSFNGLLKLRGELQDVDQAILLSGLPLPGLGQGINAELTTVLSINGSQYQARDLTGNIGDALYEAELTLDAAKRPRPHVRGKLSLSELDAEALTALVYTGTPTTGASGTETPLSESPAAQSVLAGFDADLELSSKIVHMSDDYPAARGLTSEVLVRNGDLSLEGLEADWLSGKMTGALSMAQSTAGRAFNGQMQLAKGDLGIVSRIVGLPSGLAGQLTVGGTFETAGEDTRSMLSQMTASGSMQIEKGSIAGLNSGAFSALLEAADKIKDEELAGQAAGLLETNFVTGRTAFRDIELPFTVATGSLRVNSFTLVNDAIKLVGSGKYDLATQQAELDAKIAFDPGKEVVVGAQPEFELAVNVAAGDLEHTLDASLFSTYLGMRVSERREREFEAQRSEILERQRLQQVARIYDLKEEAKRIAEAERERIRLLEIEQAEQRRREAARRRLEEIERKRIAAEIEAAEKRAAREAALEAGRRARRQEEIDLLREEAKEAAERIRLNTFEDVD